VVTPRANALGDYLRARREQLCPQDCGLVAGARRRVVGLRREEVATLAGISSAYYLRLEQGRDIHPSGQVVEALARALQLDINATDHLHRLAGVTRGRQPEHVSETVANDLDRVIDQFSMPAIVINRYQDVLAANPIARALSPGFAPGENFLRWRLLAPAARDLYVDWDEATEVAVNGFREVAGIDLDDPRMRALIEDLSVSSDRFRELWARAGVGYRGGIVHMRHPKVGDIHLHRTKLNVPQSGEQHLLIYYAEPGSESADALEDLRSQCP
jgi:transcriptional regulator with XRE-family HTH domain